MIIRLASDAAWWFVETAEWISEACVCALVYGVTGVVIGWKLWRMARMGQPLPQFA